MLLNDLDWDHNVDYQLLLFIAEDVVLVLLK